MELDVRAADESFGQSRLQRPVELDGVHLPYPIGEIRREDAETGSDLEDHVALAELRETRDHAEDVLVDEEVLTELLLRADAHGSPKATAAFASIRRPSSAGSSPRVSASTVIVCTT